MAWSASGQSTSGRRSAATPPRYTVATRGSHEQLKHPTKPGRVTVAGHPGDDLAPATLKSILIQAGLKEQ